MILNEKLKKYIENNVFPQYEKNESGHKIDHINYVIDRCFELSKDEDVNFDMLFTIAAYHDIGHHIDARNHEMISAQIMYEDKNLKEFFTEEQLIIIKEAIEDHRASSKTEPRSIYGKIVSSADRNISVDESLKRVYFYSIEHFSELSEDEHIERCYSHMLDKFGENGYTKFFFKDEKYECYLKVLRNLLNNKEEFVARLRKIISELKDSCK